MVRSLASFGHAVAADELSALRADDAVQRLAKVETVDHAFEREVARHEERFERLLRFRSERLEFLSDGPRSRLRRGP